MKTSTSNIIELRRYTRPRKKTQQSYLLSRSNKTVRKLEGPIGHPHDRESTYEVNGISCNCPGFSTFGNLCKHLQWFNEPLKGGIVTENEAFAAYLRAEKRWLDLGHAFAFFSYERTADFKVSAVKVLTDNKDYEGTELHVLEPSQLKKILLKVIGP